MDRGSRTCRPRWLRLPRRLKRPRRLRRWPKCLRQHPSSNRRRPRWPKYRRHRPWSNRRLRRRPCRSLNLLRRRWPQRPRRRQSRPRLRRPSHRAKSLAGSCRPAFVCASKNPVRRLRARRRCSPSACCRRSRLACCPRSRPGRPRQPPAIWLAHRASVRRTDSVPRRATRPPCWAGPVRCRRNPSGRASSRDSVLASRPCARASVHRIRRGAPARG